MIKKKLSVFKKFEPYMGNKSMFIPMSVIFSAISAFLNILPFYLLIIPQLSWKRNRLNLRRQGSGEGGSG